MSIWFWHVSQSHSQAAITRTELRTNHSDKLILGLNLHSHISEYRDIQHVLHIKLRYKEGKKYNAESSLERHNIVLSAECILSCQTSKIWSKLNVGHARTEDVDRSSNNTYRQINPTRTQDLVYIMDWAKQIANKLQQMTSRLRRLRRPAFRE